MEEEEGTATEMTVLEGGEGQEHEEDLREEDLREVEEQRATRRTPTRETMDVAIVAGAAAGGGCKGFMKRHRQKIVLCVVVLVAVCLLAYLIPSKFLSTTDEPLDPHTFHTDEPYDIGDPPEELREQVLPAATFVVPVESFTPGRSRLAWVQQWLEAVNDNTGQWSSTAPILEASRESVVRRYSLSASGACHSDYDFSLDNFIDGYWQGNTIVLATATGDFEACDAPLWPGPMVSNSSSQLCATTQGWSDPFARQTEVRLVDRYPIFYTCFDMVVVFPWAFGEVPLESQHEPVDTSEPSYWWAYQVKAEEYTYTWHLLYADEDDARHGFAMPKNGFFSMQLVANTTTGEIDAELLQGVTDTYEQLMAYT